MVRTIKKLPVLLGLILLLGAGLRVYRVGSEGIWLDEGVSLSRAASSPAEIVSGRDPDPSPPLYYLLLHFWIRGFGDSELSIRIPSVIFGTVSIFLLYLVGREFFDRRTGLTAALFLALAAFPVYFSREARMYSLLLTLSLASFYCLGRLIRKGSKTAGIWYLLATAGVLYTHNLGISTILAQNIFLLIVFQQSGRAEKLPAGCWYSLQGMLLILYLPGLSVVLRQMSFVRGGYWSPPPAAVDLWRTARLYAGSSAGAAILIAGAAVALLPGDNRREPGDGRLFPHRRTFLASWLLTPILFPFLLSLVSTPIYIARITIAAAPALYLLAARGLERIPGRGKQAALAGLTGVILFLPVRDFYRPPRNEPWREVVQLVEEEAGPGDGVLVSPPWYRRFCFEHYRTRTDIVTRGIPEEVFTEPGVPRLREEAKRYPRVWIVYFQQRDLTKLLEDNFPRKFQPGASRVKEYFNFQAGSRMGIRVYLLSDREED